MIKNLSVLAFLFLFIGAKAEIPQVEKQSLYAIAVALNKTFNWNEQTAVEEWRGVTITNISGQDHVTGLEISTNFGTSAFLSDQVANLVHLNKLRISFMVTNSTSNITIDCNYIQNLHALVDLQIANRGSWQGSREEELLILNPEKVTLLSNLEQLDIKIKHSQFTLPAAVTNLTKLKKLTYHNAANNTYPAIFAMNTLEEIDLNASVYGISESYSIISNNNNLKKLSLYGFFSQMPTGFYNIPNLETLVINSSTYSFPVEISNYADTLKTLSFYKSVITEPNIGNLTNLETLTLQGDIVRLQTWIGLLTNLKSLSVVGTNVSVDASVSQLTLLEHLYLAASDTISENIYTIPNLKVLILSTRNNISESVGNLTKLEHLQVKLDWVVQPTLPTSIINSTTLKKLDFIQSGPVYVVTIPDGYFTNWPNLEQFWITHRVENFDVTNRFVNNPKLKQLALWNWSDERSNIFGVLNLCQNPNLVSLELQENNIYEVDLRNVSSITADSFETMRFTDSPISKFVVDDVNHFNSLVSQGRITIQLAAPGGYSVVTSSDPCQKELSVNSAQAQTTQLYPNPVSDILSFSTTRKVTEVEVFSASGQKFAVDTYSNKADVSSLPSGLYFVRWKEDGVYKTEKIIKK